MKKSLSLIVFTFWMVMTYANDTRYYGGEILINPIQNFQCEITVKLFTHKDILPSQQIEVDMGDGFLVNAIKTDSLYLQNNTTLSIYQFNYDFSGTGTHSISFVDSTAFRQGVNVVNQLPFRLTSGIVSSFFVSPMVHTPDILDYPIIIAQINNKLLYHPLTLDSTSAYSDSDYYTYELVETNHLSIPSGFVLNPISGEITWDNPSLEGDYEFSIVIKRHRFGIVVNQVQKNFTIRVTDVDLEPTFYYNQNWLTNTDGYYEYRIAPNENLQLFFAYADSLADSTICQSVGDLFYYENPAIFDEVASQDQLYGFFDWTPDDTYVSQYPHRVNFVCHSRKDTIDLYQTLTVLIYVENEQYLSVAELEIVELNIFPNPSQGMFYLQGQSFDFQYRTVNVYARDGKLVYMQQMTSNSVNLSHLEKGIYFIQLQGNSDTRVHRIVIE